MNINFVDEFRQDMETCLYPSGDEISLRSLPGQRSLSPVSNMSDDVSAALRRSSRRRVLEKQASEGEEYRTEQV